MAEDTEKRLKDPVQIFSPTAVKFGCSRDFSCGLCSNWQTFAHDFAMRASSESQDMYIMFLAVGFTWARCWLWI